MDPMRQITAANDEEAAAFEKDDVSQIRSVVQEEFRRYLDPIWRKLENIEHLLKDLTHKDQQPMHDANKGAMNAEGLATNEGDNESTSVRLLFLNEMKLHTYQGDEIKDENNNAISIGIFDGERKIQTGPLSEARIEILALKGDFPYGRMESWTSKEFNEYRACSKNRGNVLQGICTVQLINGEASLGAIKFREGSCNAPNGMFILAARVCDDAKTSLQVQEAVMVPRKVLDRRSKTNGKSYPPKLEDKVYRLEEIAFEGVHWRQLQEAGIVTVEDFLKALNKDHDNLAKILHLNKLSKAWEKMVTHARECSLEGNHELKSYHDPHTNVVLFFNCVHFLVGARFDHEGYIASDKLSSAQQFIVGKLKERSTPMLDNLPFDHIMEGGFPIPHPLNTNASGQHAAYQVPFQGTEAVEGLNGTRIGPSCANATNKHNYQDHQRTQQAGQDQSFLASGADWCPAAELNLPNDVVIHPGIEMSNWHGSWTQLTWWRQELIYRNFGWIPSRFYKMTSIKF